MARRKGKPHHRAAGRPAYPRRPQGFRLPPGVSHHKEPVAGGDMPINPMLPEEATRLLLGAPADATAGEGPP